MSLRSDLIEEVSRQSEAVAQKLLDYLHALEPSSVPSTSPQSGHFDAHWSRYYGALEGMEWDEAPELPAERREDW
jgi:hypothetical protein